MKMHWCTCRVNLSGQGFTFVDFYPAKPVSWPEVQVLMALHGDENVFDIKPIGIADVSASEEKRRLLAKYDIVVEAVFPGRTFRMEMLMPGEGQDQKPVDAEGFAVGRMDDDDEPVTPPPEPSTDAVFKPGKHRPASSA